MRDRSSVRAFTLIEMLIVLALLAGMAALAWPTVNGLFAKSEIRSAAKQVRTALARARLDAMESGKVMQFRYQPGGKRYRIAPLSPPENELRNGDRADVARPEEEELPSGVLFGDPNVSESELGFFDPAEFVESADAESSDDEQWSSPLLFYPNGRTSNARIRLHGRRDFFLVLSLRGVTGTVTIGKLERVEEWP